MLCLFYMLCILLRHIFVIVLMQNYMQMPDVLNVYSPVLVIVTTVLMLSFFHDLLTTTRIQKHEFKTNFRICCQLQWNSLDTSRFELV